LIIGVSVPERAEVIGLLQDSGGLGGGKGCGVSRSLSSA
jgi:hypothetical protein